MDLITLSMAKPKVIDLDEYGIGQVILGLFASGGGYKRVSNMGQFFADASTSRELRLVMTGMGFRFVIDQCVRAFEGDIVAQIAFSVTVLYDGIHNINVAIPSSGDDALVYVVTT